MAEEPIIKQGFTASLKADFEENKSNITKFLNSDNFFSNLLGKVEAKTGVKRLYIFYGIAAICAIYLMVGHGAQLLCNFIGFLYPAYASVKAIETKPKEDDTKWLTYWVVYATFALFELITDIFFWWVPFYWFFKCCFLVWCMMPGRNNGSMKIYHGFIKPFVMKHQNKVDDCLDKAAGYVGKGEKFAKGVMGDAVSGNIFTDKKD